MAKNKMTKIDKISDLPFFGDPRFTHWKCCCGGIHVFIFLLIVAAVFLLVELITFCDKLTAKDSNATEIFFGVLGLLLFGIMKQSRKVLLAFLVVLAIILTVDTVLFIINNPFGSLTGDIDLNALVEELEAEADGITRTTTTTTEIKEIELAGFNFAPLKFILHPIRIIIGIYLFVVIINYRKYLSEWKKIRDAEKASKRRCISCNKKIEAKNEAKKSKEALKKAVALGDPEKGIVKSKNGKVGKKGKVAKKASEKAGVFATISAMADKIPLEVKEEMKKTAIAIGKSAFSELTGVTKEDTEKIIDTALANTSPAKKAKDGKKTTNNSDIATKKNKKVKGVAPAQVGDSSGKKSAKPSRASTASAQSKIAAMASFAMPLLSRITSDDDDDSDESEDETESEESEVEDEVLEEDEEEMEESDTEEEDADEEEEEEIAEEEEEEDEEETEESFDNEEENGGFVALVVDEDVKEEK